MNKQKNTIVIFCAVLLTILPINAVHVPFAERFRAGMRGAHWLMLIGPAGNAFNGYVQALRNRKLVEDTADEEVVAFVRSTLKEQGYDPALVGRVKIMKSRDGFSSNSIISTINVPFNSAMLEKATRIERGKQKEYERQQKEADKRTPLPEVLLKKRVQDERAELAYRRNHSSIGKQSCLLWQGIIGHEGAHVLNNDRQRNLACFALAPLVGHAVVNGATMPLRTAMRHWLQNSAQSTALRVVRGVGYIPSAIAKLSVGAIFTHAHSKYREHLADEEVRKRVRDPEILYAKAEDHKWRHKQIQDLLSRMALEDVFSKEFARTFSYQGNLKDLFERYPFLYEIVVPTSSSQLALHTHPSCRDRAQRFEAAAKKLEKELAEKGNRKAINS